MTLVQVMHDDLHGESVHQSDRCVSVPLDVPSYGLGAILNQELCFLLEQVDHWVCLDVFNSFQDKS